MNMYEFFSTAHPDTIVICPNCGGDHYESNRFSKALLLEIAREVPLLLFDGKRGQARDVLTALYAVHIENLLRPEYFCLSCGATFDA